MLPALSNRSSLKTRSGFSVRNSCSSRSPPAVLSMSATGTPSTQIDIRNRYSINATGTEVSKSKGSEVVE